MKVTFLGTGTSGGVPMIACPCAVCASPDARDKRLRTSIMVEKDGKTIVIDTGPDFRQQMLREKVQRLDAVLFTHGHVDHTGGLDDIRAFNFFQKQEMELYLDELTEYLIKRQYAYIFEKDPYPGIPRVKLHSIGKAPFEAAGMTITPIHALHHRMPVLAFRIDDFTYITDANYIAPEEKEKIKGTKVLVVNALRHEPHISHFTLQQSLDLVKELQPEQAYFTHISHQLGIHAEVEKELPDGVRLGYDGLTFEC